MKPARKFGSVIAVATGTPRRVFTKVFLFRGLEPFGDFFQEKMFVSTNAYFNDVICFSKISENGQKSDIYRTWMESGVVCVVVLNQSLESRDDLVVWHRESTDIEPEHTGHYLAEFN